MILVAGSANLDFVVRAPRIPAPGETVIGDHLKTFPGGKGANQAVACAKAGGVPTAMLLALGQDAHASPIETSLVNAGVQLHLIRDTDRATGTAFICVSNDAENAITVASGANLSLKPEHLPPLRGISHLLLQLETPLPTVTAYARAARAEGVQVVLNAAPARQLEPELLSQVDILIVNEGELASLAKGPGSIVEQIRSLKIGCVVVTLGPRGCVAHCQGLWFFQPAFPVTPLDTTGAGDTFCGALVAALAPEGSTLPYEFSESLWSYALKRASAAAALACTRAGAQSGVPSFAEVSSFLQEATVATPDDLENLRQHAGAPTFA